MTRIIRHILRGLWRLWNIFWPILLIYALLAILPSAPHQRVSEGFASSFQAEDCYGDSAGKERILCIDDNEEALLWRLRVIETAQEEIIFSTFEMRDDNSGQDVMAALYAAAERGVHVRILVDGLTGYYQLHDSSHFQALVSHENVEAKFYNPVNLARPWKISFRLHDKYLMADDTVYILETGVSVCEFLGDHSTHVKTFLIDDRLSVVGSYNLDMRSTYLDTEMMLAIDCEELNAKLRAETDECEEQSKRNAADGTVQYGAEYQAVELTTQKKAFYAVFRIFIWPIRYLL
ncbi:MAG: phospholipase D-like domain-containing protein [Lachnospiraceae bacterium]|nr:phospholipase D-like domain-containing protein [Lachnospiraceae bacterium]